MQQTLLPIESPIGDNLPELDPKFEYRAEDANGNCFTFIPSLKHRGYWYTSHLAPNGIVTFSRKPLRMVSATRRSITRIYQISAGLNWSESPTEPHEPWFVTEPLEDGRDPMTLCPSK